MKRLDNRSFEYWRPFIQIVCKAFGFRYVPAANQFQARFDTTSMYATCSMMYTVLELSLARTKKLYFFEQIIFCAVVSIKYGYSFSLQDAC